MFFSITDLTPVLRANQRLLGLDVGEKTIGLALSDIRRVIATPMHTIQRTRFAKDAAELLAIVEKHQIAAFVIGYPINMDGSEGPRCQATRQFARNLEEKSPLPILLFDERMSTMAVNRTMLEADLSRERRLELVDKMAASYMLQGALDMLPTQEVK